MFLVVTEVINMSYLVLNVTHMSKLLMFISEVFISFYNFSKDQLSMGKYTRAGWPHWILLVDVSNDS